MIRIKLKRILDDKNFETGQKITLNQVAEETHISRATLNRIVNQAGYNTNTDTINALCNYLKVTPCELLEFIPDIN